MDMLLLRTIMSTVAFTIAANLGLCFCGCARAEYDINGECCPMCAPVHRLKVQKACRRSADTICEPQEGFHCIKLNKGSCTLAVEHSECKPGQYIKQTGTAFSDTVCVNCTYGTYSNGSLMACLPHSKCETMGLAEVKAGTTSSDAKCEKVTSVGLIVGVAIPVLVAVTVALLVCIRKCKARCCNKRGCYTPHQATEKDL